jgi:hypothetical protein
MCSCLLFCNEKSYGTEGHRTTTSNGVNKVRTQSRLLMIYSALECSTWLNKHDMG